MKRFLLTLAFLSVLPAQPYSAPLTWTWTGRVHPELDWYTISTDNFNVHYHQELDEIARQGAIIAENVLPTLLKQMELDSIPAIDIILTAADEVSNGFATPFYSTFIWVDQNDRVIWLEDSKWLEQVISHELQHIVLFHRTRSWLPSPWDLLFAGMPGWVVEGTAEYETEKWRPYRADIQHKVHVLRNRMDEMDPHHDGFSKMLYWSDRFGDSTIVQTLKYRNSLKLFRFADGFKKATGISVGQFEEDWRRHMNTYYYGVRAQKEPLEEVGKVVSLPVKRMRSFMFSPDSTKIALVGRDDTDQLDQSLIVAIRDTAAEREWEKEQEKSKEKKKSGKQSIFTKLFGSEEDSSASEEKKKPILWKKEEVDFGRFHDMHSLSWSPDGNRIAYAKYHYGKKQASVWDIHLYNLETEKGKWLTTSGRATYPVWSPDGVEIVYVAHRNSTANLFAITADGGEPRAVTPFEDDTQIVTPAWSPDGGSISFAKSGPDGNLDLFLLVLENSEIQRITSHPAVDFQPVWHPDGSAISFTSHRSGTPNVHTINLEDMTVMQNSDVGDAVWTHQWVPNDTTIFARTLSDVDTARIVQISPGRTITTEKLSIRNSYSDWLKAGPAHPFSLDGFDEEVDVSEANPYRFTKRLKHVTSFVIPDFQTVGLTQWIDPLGRHLFTAGVFTDFQSADGSGLFLSYLNAEHGPLWSLEYYYNTLPVIRPYDDSKYGLFEMRNGVQFRLFHPFNRGESLSSNHLITSSVSLVDRQPTVVDSLNWLSGELFERAEEDFGLLPIPDAGKDAIISLEYRWIDRRPHRWNWLLPRQGKGVSLRVDKATSALFGTFDYTRLTADVFFNLPLGPTSIFGRVKGVTLSGTPPAQDYVGFTNDFPIYFTFPLDELAPSVTEFFPENYNPRGWSGVRLGNMLVFGTLEYRLPIIPKLLSAAFISDFGNVWNNGEEVDKLVMTGGVEGRLAFGPVVFALGQAQTLDEWGDGGKPDQYFRLALINPF